MQIKIIASGSQGNAYLLECGDEKLLIECGIHYKELQKALDFKTAKLSGCLISHEHQDHCRSVNNLLRMGVPCAMTRGTSDALGIDNFYARICESEVPFSFGAWQIMPFEIAHDAREPVGYLIQSPKLDKILYATDTCFVKYNFSKITHYMIECNYDMEILNANMSYNDALKKRIKENHFELQDVLEFFRMQDLSKTEEIYLLHASESNSDKDQFKFAVEILTGKRVMVANL